MPLPRWCAGWRGWLLCLPDPGPRVDPSSTHPQDAIEHVVDKLTAIVVPVAELVEVQREVTPRHLVVASHDPALQQRPEAVEVRRVDNAADVLAARVIDGFVRQPILERQAVIA